MPTTRSGLFEALAISAMGRAEVLVAKIAEGFMRGSMAWGEGGGEGGDDDDDDEDSNYLDDLVLERQVLEHSLDNHVTLSKVLLPVGVTVALANETAHHSV
jgi:hypothetical protein